MLKQGQDHGQATFGFGFRAFKRFPEIIPLCGILGAAAVATVFYAIYSSRKSDVVFNKTAQLPPWERIDFEKPQKLVTLNQQYQKIPELDEAKKALQE